MYRFLLVFLLVFIMISPVFSEEEMNPKKPLKAAALSFFVPGGGQFYNQHYIKAGFVIILEGSLIGLTVRDHILSEQYYDDYINSQTDTDYNKYLDKYYQRQNSLWWLGTAVFLSTIDAFVDAHLFDFDDKKKKIHLKFEDNVLSLSYKF